MKEFKKFIPPAAQHLRTCSISSTGRVTVSAQFIKGNEIQVKAYYGFLYNEKSKEIAVVFGDTKTKETFFKTPTYGGNTLYLELQPLLKTFKDYHYNKSKNKLFIWYEKKHIFIQLPSNTPNSLTYLKTLKREKSK